MPDETEDERIARRFRGGLEQYMPEVQLAKANEHIAELRTQVETLQARLGCGECECISEEQCEMCSGSAAVHARLKELEQDRDDEKRLRLMHLNTCGQHLKTIQRLEKRLAAMREVLIDVDDSSMEDCWNQELKDSVKQILYADLVAKLEATMQCNCDLDRWQPEPSTGHSWVCRIHKQAIKDVRGA